MLKKEIEKLISESLPQIVGSELKEELTRLYEVEKEFGTLDQSLLKMEKENEELRLYKIEQEKIKKTLINDQAALKEGQITLAEAQKQLFQDQARLDAKILQAKLAAAESSNGNLFRLVETIFKNPSTRRTVTESGYTNIPGSQANNWQQSQTSTGSNVTETVEEV